MEKVYSVQYTGDGSAPPTRRTRPALTIPAGKLLSTAVPGQREGFLERLYVEQTGGSPVAFTVELLNSLAPYSAGVHSDSFAPATNVKVFRVIDQQQLAAGEALELSYSGYGVAFHNQDGTYTDSNRLLYLVIIPQASGETTTWDVTLTSHH